MSTSNIMHNFRVALVLASGLALAGAATTASAQTSDTQAKNLAAYEPYIGAPVKSFHFWKLQKWELVGDTQLIVWPEINKAYLLDVDLPCDRLQWAKAVGLSSTANTVSVRFDTVDVGGQKCRITQIRPVDIKAYKQARNVK